MSYLGIDPSLTCTGWAVMGSEDGIDQAGLLKPPAKLSALERSCWLADELFSLLRELDPHGAVIEMPGRSVGARHRGGGSGLTSYGVAAGMIYQTLRSLFIAGRVIAVEPNTWTGGVPKRARQQRLAMVYPEYARQINKDKGGDIADAVGVLLWYFRWQRMAELVAKEKT